MCTDLELIQIMSRQRADAFTYQAVNGLYDLSPEHSARYVLSRAQLWFAGAATVALIAGLWIAPTPTVAVLLGSTNLFLFCAVLFKLVAVLVGVRTPLPTARNVERPIGKDLPHYTVLAPVFREPEVVKHLAEALGRLDYPLDLSLIHI